MDAIVTARENVRGLWNEQGEREEKLREQEVRQDDQLKEQVEQLAIRENELARNLCQYAQQQNKLSELIEGIGHQWERLELNSVQNIQGRDFHTLTQGIADNHTGGTNFQVKADLDIGKFSGVEPTPHDELTFKQWVCDVHVYQRQFPEFIFTSGSKKIHKRKGQISPKKFGSRFYDR